MLHQPSLRVRQRRVVVGDAVREEGGEAADPFGLLLRDQRELFGGRLRPRPFLRAQHPSDREREATGELLARAPAVDEDEHLSAVFQRGPDEARDRLVRRVDLARRQVGEDDPAGAVDPHLQRDRPEVARYVARPEPGGDLLGVADRGGEGNDLQTRVRAPEPGEAHLEGRAPLDVPHQVDFVGDDDAQPVEPGVPPAQQPVRLLARRDQHVELLELLRGEVEVADRDADFHAELGELGEVLRLLVGERPQRNEVEAGLSGPCGPKEREVGDQRLAARGRAGEEHALAGKDARDRRGLRRIQLVDPVLAKHLGGGVVQAGGPERDRSLPCRRRAARHLRRPLRTNGPA